jgi:hypothetical protein
VAAGKAPQDRAWHCEAESEELRGGLRETNRNQPTHRFLSNWMQNSVAIYLKLFGLTSKGAVANFAAG